MSDPGTALFQAICEQPWDDALRLVYADWLEEHGRPERAAFIRFQCDYPNWDSSHPQFHQLMARDKEFEPLLRDWIAELPERAGVKWKDFWFDRGFVAAVTFQSSKAFRQHAGTAFTATPIDQLEVKRLTGRTVLDVLRSSFLSRVRWLCLNGALGDTGVRLIASCPLLHRLESLCIWGSGCSDEGVEALAASPHLGGLNCLSFSTHQISDRGALALADSPNMSGLTELVLHGTRGLSRSVVNRLKKRFRRFD